MSDNVNKEINDTKVSTDTLFVLLLVICGLAIIIFVAYLLYKPQPLPQDLVIRNISVSSAATDDTGTVESVESSLKDSYLEEEPVVETPKEEEVTEAPKDVVQPVIPVTQERPIFKETTPTTAIKQTVTKTTVVKPAPKPTPKKLVTVTAYWIQVGSFSTSASANNTVETLKEKGLSSRVVLKTVNGNSVYRVRIGAYESKDEANKFLEEVKKIDGYTNSYVSETTTQMYVNQ